MREVQTYVIGRDGRRHGRRIHMVVVRNHLVSKQNAAEPDCVSKVRVRIQIGDEEKP